MGNKVHTYSSVGVDTDIEAKAAKILYEASKITWQNRKGNFGEVVIPFDDFAGLKFIRIDSLPKGTVMYGGSDGVATKAELAERAKKFDTLAFDLLAMVCDDAVIRGGEPVFIKSVLDVNTLGTDETRLPYIRQLAQGYSQAAKQANAVIINGEIAQLNDRIGDMDNFRLEWSADVTWFAHESRLITGYKVKPGDSIVSFYEPGLRCNGISLVRKLLRKQYGDNWHTKNYANGSLIEAALLPSIIYTPAMNSITGGFDLQKKPGAEIHAAAHITGGGIKEKLGRTLKASGYGALLDDLFEPCALMKHCQELGNVSDEEAYRTWNMGNGMLVITPEPAKVINIVKKHDIKARIAGQITKNPNIKIRSKGYFADKTKEVIFS